MILILIKKKNMAEKLANIWKTNKKYITLSIYNDCSIWLHIIHE